MIDLSSYYTYTGVNEPPQPNKAFAKPSNQGEQLRFQREKERANIYSKNYDDAKKSTDMKIDAGKLASGAARELTSKLLDRYNELQATLLHKNPDGTLSDEDKKTLRHEAEAIDAEVYNFADSQKRRDEIWTWARSHREDVDEDALNKADEQWNKTGVYPLKTPVLKPQDPQVKVGEFTKLVHPDFIPDVTMKVKDKDGQERLVKGKARINPNSPTAEKDIDATIEKSLYYNPRAGETVKRLFVKLPLMIQHGFIFDENGDRKISTDEYDNGIMRFAKTIPELRQQAMEFVPDEIKKETDADAEKGVVEATLSGAKVKMSPGVGAANRTYGGKKYPSAYVFGNPPTVYNIPTAGSKLLVGKYNPDVDPGNISGKILLYDHYKHVFVIETTASSGSADTAPRVLVEVPESNVEGWETIPLRDDKGVFRAGYWKGNATTPIEVPTTSGKNKWEPYKTK